MPDLYSLEPYDEAAELHSTARAAVQPHIGLILGSGLSGLADSVEQATVLSLRRRFPTSEPAPWPVMPAALSSEPWAARPSASCRAASTSTKATACKKSHFPVRVMQRMGVHTLILTNAAGGVNPRFHVGDLMLIQDHINFVGMAGHNPLSGPNLEEFGPRFPGANRIYTQSLRRTAGPAWRATSTSTCTMASIPCSQGPTSRRRQRFACCELLGTDAVGMSTVPEALVAHHAGMDVLAISTITNVDHRRTRRRIRADPRGSQAAGNVIVPKLTELLLGILAELDA